MTRTTEALMSVRESRAIKFTATLQRFRFFAVALALPSLNGETFIAYKLQKSIQTFAVLQQHKLKAGGFGLGL